jgi:hypothetical protein
MARITHRGALKFEHETAYLHGELCGLDAAGLPSFAHTQPATDGERQVRYSWQRGDHATVSRRALGRCQIFLCRQPCGDQAGLALTGIPMPERASYFRKIS